MLMLSNALPNANANSSQFQQMFMLSNANAVIAKKGNLRVKDRRSRKRRGMRRRRRKRSLLAPRAALPAAKNKSNSIF